MLKFANTTGAVGFQGRVVHVAEGDAWHADDPFVIAFPDFFSDQPARVFGTRPAQVEQASAAPGERRTTKRG